MKLGYFAALLIDPETTPLAAERVSSATMDMPPPPPRAPPAAKPQQPEDDLSWAVTPPPPFHSLEHFKDGSLAGATTLDKKVISIGRDADADLTILHPTASRRHASIINGEDRQLFLVAKDTRYGTCLLYTSPSPRDGLLSRMPSSA